MFRKQTLIADTRRTLRLAIPLMGAQLLQMGNGLVDTLVAGRLGREALAASGLGASLWFFSSLLCIGLMAGLSPTLSRMIGQKRRAAVGAIFRQGLWLAALVGLIAWFTLIVFIQNLSIVGIQEELLPLIRQYLYPASFSLPAFAIVMACRNVCESTGVAAPVVFVTLLGLVLNIIGDLGFGLGMFGLPRLGLFGIGLTTTAVGLAMAIALALYLRKPQFDRYNLYSQFDRVNWKEIAQLLSLSVPIFLGLVFEAGLFAATMLQMGIFGTLETGAHSIALSATSFCYMLPLGLSFALTARMGRAYGHSNLTAMKLRATTGLLLTLILAVSTAVIILLMRYPVTGFYTSDKELRELATHLLLFAALFQLSDASQVTLIGLLRGMGDTLVPMLINAFSYWCIAFGVGYYCAHTLNMRADGLWIGLICGLSLASILLAARLRSKLITFKPTQDAGIVRASH